MKYFQLAVNWQILLYVQRYISYDFQYLLVH